MTVQRYKHEKKLMPCRTCGVGIEVGIRTQKSPQHFECSLRNMYEAMSQMSAKSGPRYEKWLANGGANGRPKGRGTPLDQGEDGGGAKV